MDDLVLGQDQANTWSKSGREFSIYNDKYRIWNKLPIVHEYGLNYSMSLVKKLDRAHHRTSVQMDIIWEKHWTLAADSLAYLIPTS